jgi:Tfp pilus assembly protein PilX
MTCTANVPISESRERSETVMKKLAKGEKGYVLIAALVVLVVLGLIAGPLLSYMVNGLRAGHVAEVGATELYAADAGIQDALWRIKNLGLADFLPGYDEYAYFDYDPSWAWEYPIPGGVNGKNVTITIQNVWIPMDVDAPARDTARAIIEGTGENDPQLTITGTVSNPGASKYEVKISWDQTCAGPKNSQVSTIGVWLPSSFEYVMGSSDLEEDSGQPYYSTVSVKAHKGGHAVVWTPVSPVTLNSFSPLGSFTFEFEYDGPQDQVPGAAVPWIVTTGDDGFCAWDADVKIYDIVSTASDPDIGSQTTVESYSTKTDARQLGSAIAGDYVAIGNSLMLPDPNNGPNSENDWRSLLLKESSASVDTYAGNTIPAGATITAAYLYWSGWMDHYYWYYDGGWKWSDDQDNLTGLVYDPINQEGMVEGYGNGKGAEVNVVNFGSADNMQDIPAGKWAVWPKTNDSPACWYYCCVSDVTGVVRPLIQSGVTTFTLGYATTAINQLRPEFPRLPGAPSGDHTSPGYSFNLYDASGQTVVGYTGYPLGTPAHGLPGSSVYERRYHAAYAGWSLIIIYSTPSTDIKNQLYVYDITDPDFVFKESYPQGASVSNPDFDGDGMPGGRISGFLVPQQVDGEVNAAKITCFVGEGDRGKTGDSFSVTGPSSTGAYLLDGTQGCDWNDVWNSRSVDPQVKPGIDIDYFYVTWASNILRTGDTWAQVDIPTDGDGFTLCYVVLSFRSSITTGDILGYLIRR